MADRISDLPDHVLEKLLCFLPFKDAVRTSVLSRRWRRMDPCCMFPDLNFGQVFFEKLFNLDGRRTYNKNVRKKNRRYLNGLDKLLRRRGHGNNPIVQKFHIKVPVRHERRPETHPFIEVISRCPLQRKLQRWMTLVSKPGLTVLDLRIYFRKDEYYNFPMSILAATKSLNALCLAGFQLMPLSSVDVSFPCLGQMRLENIVLDDCVMQKLFKGSPLLENLVLDRCNGLKTLKVEGLSRLKMLQVIDPGKGLGMIVLDAPYLSVLRIGASPSVVTVVTGPECLQKLDIDWETWDTWDPSFKYHQGRPLPIARWLCGFAEKCQFLRHLTIASTPSVTNIRIDSTLHGLKTLNLICGEDFVILEIHAPNLEKFRMVVKETVPSIHLNALEKLQVEFCFTHLGLLGEPTLAWYYRFAIFLKDFKDSKALILSCYDDKRCFISKKHRNEMSQPLLGLQNLEFRMLGQLTRPLIDYVDYMLWLSAGAAKLTFLTSINNETSTHAVLKCLYNESRLYHHYEVIRTTHSGRLKVRCWRHCLEEVRIEDFQGDEMEKQNIQNFFQEEVENLEFTGTVFDVDSLLDGGLYSHYNALFK